MGIDLWQETKSCKTCGHQESLDSYSCTYNLSPMWRAIYPDCKGLLDIDDLTGNKALKRLEYAHKYLLENPMQMEMLNPPNGWGTYGGFVELIEKLIAACKENPKLIWRTWR